MPRSVLVCASTASGLKVAPLDPLSEEFGALAAYVADSAVHGYGLKLTEAFALDGKASVVEGSANRRLAFHGTRRVNLAGLLTDGLKLRNGALKTGAMFDTGLYAAVHASKSYNYGFGSNVLFAVELALVNPLEPTSATPDAAARCKAGGHGGVHARGRTTVDGWKAFPGDRALLKYPSGFEDGPSDSTLLYDELVVYDEKKIGLAYALVVEKVGGAAM